MGILESLFASIATWLGYVGSCAVAPDATCRPFLAFIALGAAASAALTLVLIAYRSARAREVSPANQPQIGARSQEVQERLRRMIAGQRLRTEPALRTGLRVA